MGHFYVQGTIRLLSLGARWKVAVSDLDQKCSEALWIVALKEFDSSMFEIDRKMVQLLIRWSVNKFNQNYYIHTQISCPFDWPSLTHPWFYK